MPAAALTLGELIANIKETFWSKTHHNVSTNPSREVIRAFDIEDAAEAILENLGQSLPTTLGPILGEMIFAKLPTGTDDHIEGSTLLNQAIMMMVGSIAVHLRATCPDIATEEARRRQQYPLEA